VTNPRLRDYEQFRLEWAALWESDLEGRAERRDALIAWKGRLCGEDESPLLDALRAAGFDGKSVWDLVNTREAYPELLETLRQHACYEYLPPTREGIFRALTLRDAGDRVFDTLVRLWRDGVGLDNKFLRWALANAISHNARSGSQRDELASLIDGDEYSNDPFVRRLRKSRRGRELLGYRSKETAH
jgi:hypothetical protein